MKPLLLKQERDPIEPVWLWNIMCRIGAIRMWLKETEVEPVTQNRKMMAGNIAGIVFLFALAFAGVWVAVDKLGCWLLNWCH